ncbi:hypothetical protein FP74_gp088 [Bacillus phage CAM003]|uniref:Uncharacterized protein n=2 Tax=Bastillevirus TaxID=1918010 RepID=A0A024B3H0_9CAUD|nr:hypothetical protein FP73_gp085 [Bacillus phage Hoody T]YP_009037174.1 hypothetical protein FP74_gp088 [Bacillus phage CAM003]AHZ09708.1 hypothetical protein [Bacillus phage CAM003]AHZ10568.1 hypothetical protein [Bacillus phage Hoody T]
MKTFKTIGGLKRSVTAALKRAGVNISHETDWRIYAGIHVSTNSWDEIKVRRVVNQHEAQKYEDNTKFIKGFRHVDYFREGEEAELLEILKDYKAVSKDSLSFTRKEREIIITWDRQTGEVI